MARVQVNDLREGIIRPVQTAGDTYGGYDKPEQNNDMSRLAQALGVAAQAAGQFVKPKNDAEVYRFLSTNPQGTVNAAAAGQVPVNQSPWGQGAQAPALVTQAAENDARKLTQSYMEGIKSGLYPVLDDNDNPVDHDANLARLGAEHYSGPGSRFANNPLYTKKFYETTQGSREELTKMASEKYAEALQQKWQAPVQQGLTQIIKGLDAGKVDEDGAREVWNSFKAEINARTKGVVPWKTLDDLMVGQMRTLATQNPQAVLRLLDLDRGVTKEGVKLGAIGDPVGKYGQAANEIRQTAFKELEKRFDTDIKEQRIAAVMDAARKGNQLIFGTLKDETYDNPWSARLNPGRTNEPRTMSAEEIRKEAINRLSTGSLDELRQQGLDPETAAKTKMERDVQLYIGQNVPNPEWKGVLNGAATIYGNPTAVAIPQNFERLKAARQLYETLKTQAPGYLEKTLGVTKEDRDFYDRTRAYVNLRGMDEREAMARASQAIIGSREEPLSGAEIKKIEQKAASMDLSWWPAYGGGANTGKVKRDILEVAKTLVSDRELAGNMDAVMEEAKKIVSERSLLLNGQILSGDPHVTQGKLPAWEERLKEITTKYGNVMTGYDGQPVGVTNWKNLSVRPMAGGSYYQVIKSTGEPVLVPIVQSVNGKNVVTGSMPLTIHPKEIDMISQRMFDEELLRRQVEAELAPSRAIANGSIPNDDKNRYFQPVTPSREDVMRGLTDPAIREQRMKAEAEARQKLYLHRYGGNPPYQPDGSYAEPGIWGEMAIGQPPHTLKGD